MLSELDVIKSTERLGTTFHRTFSFIRPAIAQILNLAFNVSNPSGESMPLSMETIRQKTQLGTIYVEAMPRYARGAGLLDKKNRLTEFGRYITLFDRNLNKIDTLWLIHYYLSSPHGYGPAFWNDIFTSVFLTRNEFSRDDLIDIISSTHLRVAGKPLRADYTRSTAAVFLGTYLKDEGLAKLRILASAGPDRYRVLAPEPPSPWAFGYALLDYWHAQFGERLTVNVDALSGKGRLADLFLIGASRLDAILRVLQSEGYVDVYRYAPPYQVVLLRQDPEPLLEKIYAIDDAA